MKSAEEYAHELCCKLTASGFCLSYPQERELKRLVQETFPKEQLDAMKECADICLKTKTGQREDSRVACHDNILTAAEQLTIKDLT